MSLSTDTGPTLWTRVLSLLQLLSFRVHALHMIIALFPYFTRME